MIRTDEAGPLSHFSVEREATSITDPMTRTCITPDNRVHCPAIKLASNQPKQWPRCKSDIPAERCRQTRCLAHRHSGCILALVSATQADVRVYTRA